MAVQILMLRLRHLPHFRQPSQLRSKRIQKRKTGPGIWTAIASAFPAACCRAILNVYLTRYAPAFYLEVFSKPHLRLNGCVVPRIEILTYLRVRSVFNPRNALPLNLIWGFETTSNQNRIQERYLAKMGFFRL